MERGTPMTRWPELDKLRKQFDAASDAYLDAQAAADHANLAAAAAWDKRMEALRAWAQARNTAQKK